MTESEDVIDLNKLAVYETKINFSDGNIHKKIL